MVTDEFCPFEQWFCWSGSAMGDHLIVAFPSETRCGGENTCLTDMMPKLWRLTRFLCFGVLSLSVSVVKIGLVLSAQHLSDA